MTDITKATPSLSVDGFTFDLQRFATDTWDGTAGTVPDAVDGVITITTAEQLAALAVAVNGGSDYSGVTIKLGADLDLSGHNWTPIGNSSNQFKGTFDGDGHTISNLTSTGTSDSRNGLFGNVGTGGTVQNVTLINATVSGDWYVGGLVGLNFGTVSGNTVSGVTVSGTRNIGGLVGQNNGTVQNCTVSGEVSGTTNVGGLVGYNYRGGTVTGCTFYSNLDAVGNDIGTVDNNTRLYKLTLPEGVTAEFTGGDDYKVTINGTTYYKSGATFKLTVTDFPDGQYLKGATADDGNYTYTMSNTALEWADIPTIGDLEFDRSINAFKISTAEQLQTLATFVNEGNTCDGLTFKLTDDIDLSSVSNFTPIGNGYYTFKGTFDGDNHTISNLTVNLPKNDFVGLFGVNDGTIKNVTLTNATVSGDEYVGGVVGENYGTVSSCTVSGKVNGSWGVGGLIGQNYGTIIGNTVDNISVTATGNNAWVGGLAAYNEYGTVSGNTVINSTITATNNGGVQGGLVGFTDIGTITDNIVDVKITVGTSTNVGGLVGTNQGGTVAGNIVVSEITAGDNSYVGSVVAYEKDNSSSVKNNFFHSTANDIVGYFNYSGGNENITDNNPLFVVTLPGGVTASGDTCFTVDGIAYAVGNITLAAKLGYVYSGTTSAEITADIDLSNLGTATLDPANHYAFKDGDGYTFATADNVASNNYPDLVQVYELTVPDSLTVSGDIVATADGKTYAAGEVTLTAAKGYTLKSISVDGSTLDGTTFTVDAATEISAESFKSINGGKGVEFGGKTGDFSAESGVYSITASQENSTVVGNTNNNNVIIAGGGENILTGGGGNDTYKFSAGGGIVTDYGIGATKNSAGQTLSAPLGSDVIKIDGKVSGVYFDRDASSKKSATFTAVITYGTGDDTQIIVLQNINKKPTKYSSDPSKAVYQTNDVAAATLKIWDTSGSKQAVLSAAKLKALFRDDSELSDLSSTVQTQLVKLDGIGDLNLPAVDQLNQNTQATFNGGE